MIGRMRNSAPADATLCCYFIYLFYLSYLLFYLFIFILFIIYGKILLYAHIPK